MSSDKNPSKKIVVSAQKDPKILWEGWSGPVEIGGMRFHVVKEKTNGAELKKAIYVLDAPPGTELYGLGGSDVYVTVAQLHFEEFRSRIPEDSRLYKEAKCIWDFLHRVFVEAGFETVKPSKARARATPASLNVSASVKDFVAGILGVYCFDEHSPKAVFEVKYVSLDDKSEQSKKDVLVVELILAETGHPICEYCRPKTYMFHKLLAWGNQPNFKGARAGDAQKLWEFLADKVVEHRGMETAHERQTVPFIPKVDCHSIA